MKAGAEAHFLSGQLFMLAVVIMAVVPRLPFDTQRCSSVGGRLSFPFRRALLALIGIGVSRTLSCHLHHPDSKFLAALDVVFGTIQVVGQSFLCLTTAYILQCQLTDVINIQPGQSLMPALVLVLVLTISGSMLSVTVHPNWCCLVNLAEAISCIPVLKTIEIYARVTTGQSHGRGSVLVQTVRITEYWFLATAFFSFIAEATDDIHGNISKLDSNNREQQENIDIQNWALSIILEAIRNNQNNGIDDYMRLLVHSIFLNVMDELQHFTNGLQSPDEENTECPPSPTTVIDTEELKNGLLSKTIIRRTRRC